MRYRASVSYESETQPVNTIRVEFEAGSAKSATVRAAREANKRRPAKRAFRSWVIVLERLDAAETAQAMDQDAAA